MRILWMLLLANLCDLAGDFEGRGFAVGIGYGDFSFAGAAVADGDGESGAVCVAGSSLFDDIHLDGVEGEDPQRRHALHHQAPGAGSPVAGARAQDPRRAQRHDHGRRRGERAEDGALLEQGGEEAARGEGQGAEAAARVHDAEPARLPEGAAGGRRQEGDEYPRTQPQKDDEEEE